MDMKLGHMSDTGLDLGLAIGGSSGPAAAATPSSPLRSSFSHKAPSLNLSLSDDVPGAGPTIAPEQLEAHRASRLARPSSPNSAVSSFSPAGVKKEKGAAGDEEPEVEKVSSRASDEDDDGGARKKLRLTKDQSALLEDRFKEHSTLNPKQKQALAKQLNLRPRQVEVWFQNRRARTKLKQTEVDCEFLKRCCEKLTEENRRLHKELQELKTLKFGPPLYMQFPAAAAVTVCPSCERICGAKDGPKGSPGGGAASTAGPFVMAPKPHFFNPFSHSATC